MKNYDSLGRKLFLIINSTVLIITAVLCILPLIHVLALSFSSNLAAQAGSVKLLPVDFSTLSYKYVLAKKAFWLSMSVSAKRIVLGLLINMLLTVSVAYPLSKEVEKFRLRTVYVWIFFITTLFSGGLIPLYMLIYNLKLMDTIWALVLPGAVPVFNVILMLNFFRQIPKELEEAAFSDGATHWQTLFKIYIPCSLPSIATIALFSIVGHWNSYFDGLIFSNDPKHYPLQTYLRTIIINKDISQMSQEERNLLQHISERTIVAAQIFIGAIPILSIYPFLQKYFVKGIVVGSVKG